MNKNESELSLKLKQAELVVQQVCPHMLSFKVVVAFSVDVKTFLLLISGLASHFFSYEEIVIICLAPRKGVHVFFLGN